MKRLVSILTMFSLLLMASPIRLAVSAQDPPPGQDPMDNFVYEDLPPDAIVGSTPQRQDAWNSLTSEEQAALEQEFTVIEGGAAQQLAAQTSMQTQDQGTLPQIFAGEGLQADKDSKVKPPKDVTLAFFDEKSVRRKFHKAKSYDRDSDPGRKEPGKESQFASNILTSPKSVNSIEQKTGGAGDIERQSVVITDQGTYYKSVDQFVMEFYAAAFARQPNSDELQVWRGYLLKSDG